MTSGGGKRGRRRSRGKACGCRSRNNAEQGTTDMHTSIEGRADFGPLFPRDFVEGGATVMASSAADITFDRVKTQLKARIGAEVFSSWFARMKLAETSK